MRSYYENLCVRKLWVIHLYPVGIECLAYPFHNIVLRPMIYILFSVLLLMNKNIIPLPDDGITESAWHNISSNICHRTHELFFFFRFYRSVHSYFITRGEIVIH